MKLLIAILAILLVLAILGIIDVQLLLHDAIDAAKEFFTTLIGGSS